jgi:hypothetical protein
MLDWLRRLFDPSATLAPVSLTGSGNTGSRRGSAVRVTSEGDQIVVTRPNGRIDSLLWSDLGVVGVVTTDDGPFATDLFWLLQSSDKRQSLTVPLGAIGESDLLHMMQARLKGFDNMAVVEAMSSVGNTGFTVWDATWPLEDRN